MNDGALKAFLLSGHQSTDTPFISTESENVLLMSIGGNMRRKGEVNGRIFLTRILK
jgi:hypothetical protein